MRLLRVTATILTLALLLLTSCGRSDSQALPPTKVESMDIELPPMIAGLTVTKEDVSEKVQQKKGAFFVEELALFTLREGELLRGSLQVSRLRETAPYQTERFKLSVVGLMGGGAPRKIKMGKEQLFLSSGNQRHIFTLFRGRGYVVLTVRRDYPTPRTLARSVLDLELDL